MTNERYKMRDFALVHGFKIEKHSCFGSYVGYRVHIRYRPLGKSVMSVDCRNEHEGER